MFGLILCIVLGLCIIIGRRQHAHRVAQKLNTNRTCHTNVPAQKNIQCDDIEDTPEFEDACAAFINAHPEAKDECQEFDDACQVFEDECQAIDDAVDADGWWYPPAEYTNSQCNPKKRI